MTLQANVRDLEIHKKTIDGTVALLQGRISQLEGRLVEVEAKTMSPTHPKP
jgi:hypothetical protein